MILVNYVIFKNQRLGIIWLITATILLLQSQHCKAAAQCKVAVDLYNQAVKEAVFTEQVKLLKQALSKDCDNKAILSRVNNNLGNAHEQLGQMGEAKKAYHEATLLDPTFSTSWLSLGDIAQKQGDQEQADRLHDKGFILDNYQSANEIIAQLSPTRGIRVQRKPRATFYFGFDDANLSDETILQLEAFHDALLSDELRNYRFSLEGHTDSRGTEHYNEGLSQQRLDSVNNWLVGQGLDQGRLLNVAYGESMPATDNSTAEGRRKNRRVEVTVLSVYGSTRASGNLELMTMLRKGEDLLANGQYIEAEKVFLKLLRLSKQSDKSDLSLRTERNLVIMYSVLGKWDLAEKICENSLVDNCN